MKLILLIANSLLLALAAPAWAEEPPSPEAACAAFVNAVRDHAVSAEPLMRSPSIAAAAARGCRDLEPTTVRDAALGLATVALRDREGVSLVRQAAQNGSAEALFFFAIWHRSGLSLDGRAVIAPRAETYRTLLHRAAELGHGPAQTALGAAYMTGDGVRKDNEQAAVWFKRAAKIGVPQAIGALANFHRLGLGGLTKDRALALDLNKQAAALGDETSRWLIAYWTLYDVEETGQSISQALADLETLSREGHLKSAVTLGTLYAEGLHVERDLAYARTVYCRVGERGERAYGAPEDGPLDCRQVNPSPPSEGE